MSSSFTFSALALTLRWGSAVCASSLLAFGIAVRFGANPEIAPRTWARPKQVIKNVLKQPYFIRWISWALSLSYRQMLEGIDGTGTRKQGFSGSKLKCNLDGIIVCKFNAICLRVSALATFLCMLVVLPLNYTAYCLPQYSGIEVCKNLTNLTDFENTTLAHIPPYGCENCTTTETNGDELQGNDSVVDVEYVWSLLVDYLTIYPHITPRLYAIVLVAWCIYIYTCFLIWIEWHDNLAMRRAYYLERNHYEDRKEELDYLGSLQDPEDPKSIHRAPYLPHPELRETVPSVCLYSVLYKLPDYLSNRIDAGDSSTTALNTAECIDFFDRIIPNQPGFSSSVVAMTILPDASQVTHAWKKWYKCAAKLRRLRYIRKRIDLLEKKDEEFADKGLEEFEPFLHRASKMDSSGSIRFSTDDSGPRGSDRTSQPFFPPVENGDYTIQGSSNSNIVKEQNFAEDDDKVPYPCKDSSLQNTQDNGVEKPDLSPNLDSDPNNENEIFLSDDQKKSGRDEGNDVLHAIEEFFGTVIFANDQASTNGGTEESEIEDKSSVEPTNESTNITPADDVNASEDVLDPAERSPVECAQTPDLEDSSAPESDPKEKRVTFMPSSSPPSAESDDKDSQRLHGVQIPNHPMNQRQRRTFMKYEGQSSSSEIGDDMLSERFRADDGIEQLSVYCKEFAQSSGGCCPYGCDAFSIRMAALDKLEELEEEAEEEAKEANRELIEARKVLSSTMMFNGDATESVGDRCSRQLSLLNEELESSSDESSSDEAPNRPLGRRSVMRQRRSSSQNGWKQANRNLRDGPEGALQRRSAFQPRKVASGKWRLTASIGSYFQKSGQHLTSLRRFATETRYFVNRATERSTYAVVTFSSRQAAIAARQCLADGSGWDRWKELEDVPVPPLADGPAFNLLYCKGICKPVTLTLNENRKKYRRKCTSLGLAIFYIAYSIPLSYISSLLSSQVTAVLPKIGEVEDLSGFITGLAYSLFFSVCPLIFKAFANYGSGATSIRSAEYFALRYYWFFILITAYFTTSLLTIVRNGLYGFDIGAQTQEILRQVANTLPTQISATWLNWILVRIFTTIPLTYLFQSNTFLFRLPGFGCCSRLMRGGGPGGPMPYRIFVDTGTVFLCTVALAPVCPIVAPAAFLYFLLFTPLIRWLLLFVYRPEYDGGGLRWPLVHDIFISSLLLSQLLLTVMMALKRAYGPAFLAFLAMIPTYLFNDIMKDRFLRSYRDAGLFQTSELDGWDQEAPTSPVIREEFRRWLVDAHKASFVPICLAGFDNFLTMEPAVVVPTERDDDDKAASVELEPTPNNMLTKREESALVVETTPSPDDDSFSYVHGPKDRLIRNSQAQRGAFFRRSPKARAILFGPSYQA